MQHRIAPSPPRFIRARGGGPVSAGLWMCAVASAFTYGAVIRLRGNQPVDREERQACWAVTGAVWGTALLSATESWWLHG